MEPANMKEFQELAKQSLPKMFYDFYAAGAEDEHTLKENELAFRRFTILPNLLIGVNRVDLSTTLLGSVISSPILIAPTSYHMLAHPDGEVATARAASSCNTLMVLSSHCTCTLEEVAAASNGILYLQLYVYRRRDITEHIVKRAEKCGFKALVLTVDVPRLGRREIDIKNKMIAPKLKNFEGLISTELSAEKGSNLELYASTMLDPTLSWKDIEWLRSITKLPILIKGILTGEDATMAVNAGVEGIVVSNHGARQLDYTPPTIGVLEEIAQAVGGRIPVLLDGGVRRGSDVFKALALGARAVLVGRPIVFGLAADGETGVKRVIGILNNELSRTMAVVGCRDINDIRRSHVKSNENLLSML